MTTRTFGAATSRSGLPGPHARRLATAPLELQRAAVLAAVRLRPQSRSELTGELGLSASVVSRLVGRLLKDDMLCQVGVETVGLGRPRITLGVAPGAGRLVSLVLGRDMIDAQVVDVAGRPLAAESRRVDGARLAPEAVVDFVAAVLELEPAGAPLWGIGVSAPGVVDGSGAIRAAPDLGWTTPVPLRALLQERFGPLVTVDNDVNLMMLAEAAKGWARAERDAALLYLGHRGIGMGAISQGSLLTGATGASGEIGLIPLGPRSQEFGSFEDAFSLEAVSRTLEAYGWDPGDDPMAALVHAAENGVACDYLDSLVSALTQAVGIAALILDPQIVIVAGALRGACRGREEELERALVGWLPAAPRIRLSDLGEQEIHWAAQMRCWEQIVATGL